MSRRAIAILAVNVIVFCAFAEAIALAVFYYQHGWIFYLDPYVPRYESIAEAQQQLTRQGVHPYFGPTHKPGIPFDVPSSVRGGEADRGAPGASTRVAGVATNNFGFTSRYNYPFQKTRSDQFVVGIFGGSVGDWFCQLGAARLAERLKQHSFFSTRDVITLCLSHEGYKQPQQLLLLAYFLSIGQQFDLVVNIDGFNEVALSAQNNDHGIDISMPSFGHLSPLVNLVDRATLTPAKLESLATISRYKERLNELAERINRSRLASVRFVREQYYRVLLRRYRDELLVFDKLPSNPSESSLIQVTPAVKHREGAMVFEDIARSWAQSSLLMNDLAAAGGAPYFEVVQPNQYFTTRRFGPEEAKVAIAESSPFRPSVEQGYPLLVREVESGTFRTRNVRVLDATRIFDREPRTVYMDNCCHYTMVGNEILADFIADGILTSSGPWNSATR